MPLLAGGLLTYTRVLYVRIQTSVFIYCNNQKHTFSWKRIHIYACAQTEISLIIFINLPVFSNPQGACFNYYGLQMQTEYYFFQRQGTLNSFFPLRLLSNSNRIGCFINSS